MSTRCYEMATQFAACGDSSAPADKFQWFITAHVAKSKQAKIHQLCKDFRNRIDTNIIGRRHRLYKMVWIEEGAQLYSNASGTAHTHWVFEQPSDLTEAQFQSAFKSLWKEIAGSANIDFRLIENGLGGINGVIRYCLKEALHGNFGTFIEACSDNARVQKNRETIIHPCFSTKGWSSTAM